MPVVPIFAAIGSAVGASAGTAAATGALLTASVATAGVSAYMSASAASKQASTAAQIANYNAKVDEANAQQLAMNANANIQKQRQDNGTYLSAQRAAYAASGVLSGTGSPMAVLATTAGRQEQDIQQYYASTQEEEQRLYGAAQLGVYEGAEEADMYHLQGAADIFKGIGGMVSLVGQSYAANH